MNGDGFDDLLIGAPQGVEAGNSASGAGHSYLIFGGAGLSGTIDLASLGAAGVMGIGMTGGFCTRRTTNAPHAKGRDVEAAEIGAALSMLDGIRRSVRCGHPYGGEEWVRTPADQAPIQASISRSSKKKTERSRVTLRIGPAPFNGLIVRDVQGTVCPRPIRSAVDAIMGQILRLA